MSKYRDAEQASGDLQLAFSLSCHTVGVTVLQTNANSQLLVTEIPLSVGSSHLFLL